MATTTTNEIVHGDSNSIVNLNTSTTNTNVNVVDNSNSNNNNNNNDNECITTNNDDSSCLCKVDFTIEQKPNEKPIINGKTQNEILNGLSMGLTCYETLCKPREINSNHTIKFTSSQIERILNEILHCNICNDIYQEPVNIKNCLHKFCKKCIEDYNRKIKKECAICRHPVETRRLMKEDLKLKQIINCLIPDIDKFREEEQKMIMQSLPQCRFKDEERIKQQIEQAHKVDDIESKEIMQRSLEQSNNNNNHSHNTHNHNHNDSDNDNNCSNNLLGNKTQRDDVSNSNNVISMFNSGNKVTVKLNVDDAEESLKKYFYRTQIHIEDHYNLDFISRFICYKQNYKYEQIKKIQFYTLNNDKSKKFWAQTISLKEVVDYYKEHNLSQNSALSSSNESGNENGNGNGREQLYTPNTNTNVNNYDNINLFFLISQ